MPNRIDRYGIRDDRREDEPPLRSRGEELFQEKAIEWVCGDNDGRLFFVDHFAQVTAHSAQCGQIHFQHPGGIQQFVNLLPHPRRPVDGREICLAAEVVQASVANFEEVEDICLNLVANRGPEGVADIFGGGVMPFTEARGEDENFMSHSLRA